MRELAAIAGDQQVETYGQDLSHAKRLRLWQRTYDSVLTALHAYENTSNANRIRARALASEN